MFKKIVLSILLILFVKGCDILDITKYGCEQYQNIVINGLVVPNMPPTNGQQPEKRYEIIKDFLNLYQRSFTMLDIGAAQGYHSLRAAWDFPNSVFVMIEGNNPSYPLSGDQLLSICKCNTKLDNIIHLNKPIYINDLIELGKCEHFDVVLALNIIHWLGSDYKQVIEALLTLGDHIIIETPPAEEGAFKENIIRCLEQEYKAQHIGWVPRHVGVDKFAPMYLIKSEKSKTLSKSTWIGKKKEYEIISDFKEKKLKKIDDTDKSVMITDWIPGINLITFKMYAGAFPLLETLKDEIDRLKDAIHNDWKPNNFVIQGNYLSLIDFNSAFCMNDSTKPETYDRFKMMLKFLEAVSPNDVKYWFGQVTSSSREQLLQQVQKIIDRCYENQILEFKKDYSIRS